MRCAGYGRLSLAKKLLAAGADINATNKAGQKPIDAAKMNGEVRGPRVRRRHRRDSEPAGHSHPCDVPALPSSAAAQKSVVKFLQEHAADAEGEEAKKQDA